MIKIWGVLLCLVSTTVAYAGPSCETLSLAGNIRLTIGEKAYSLVLTKVVYLKNAYRIAGVDAEALGFNRVAVMSNGEGCEMTWFNQGGPRSREFAVTPIRQILSDGRISIGNQESTSFLGMIEPQ